MASGGASGCSSPSRGTLGADWSVPYGRSAPDPRRPSISETPTVGAADRTDALSTDRATVQAVLAGDRDAFRRLVDRESADLVRTCHRILGDLHDAEDAAQEAFVTAYRALPTWRGDGPFGAWLARIGVRIALRKAGQRRAVTWRDPGGSTPDVDPITAAMDQRAVAARPTTDPSSLTVRAEQASDLRAAVSGLPEPYREVVVLRFFGERSLEEIASATGRPLGTVKTHLRRGLLRLRASLGEGVDE